MEDKLYLEEEYENIISKLYEYKKAIISFVFTADLKKIGNGTSAKGNVFYNGKNHSSALDENTRLNKTVYVVPHYDKIIINFTSVPKGDPERDFGTNMMNIKNRSECFADVGLTPWSV